MSTSSHTPEPWFICSTEPAEIRTHPYLGSTIGHTIPNAHNAHRIVACVNACKGMADPAADIEAMRATLKESASHLSGFLGFHSDSLTTPQMRSISECLAKLKPYAKP